MKKLFIVVMMLMGIVMSQKANAATILSEEELNLSWQFYANAKPTSEQLAGVTENGAFGKEASYLYEELNKLCVKRVPIVPGDPTTRIVFVKGDLFNAVRKIEKELDKNVKSKKLTQQDATNQMNHVLNVALAAFYSNDSQSFEKALRSHMKDYKELLVLFNKVVLIN